MPHTPTLLPVSHHGTRYPVETRDLAYQLWAFKHGRNASSVAVELQDQCPGLTARTVERWAHDGGWADQASADFRTLAPAIREQVIADLIAGSAEAATHLRAVARGEAKAEPARVNACVALLDRTGFVVRKDATPLEPARPDPRPALPATTDPDELQRRMQVLIERSRRRG